MKEKIRIQELSPTLLQQGKSKRLAAIRDKVSGQSKEAIKPQRKASPPTALEQAQQHIDQALRDWLARYPPAKKNRFFKIRFGMDIEQLKQLPIQEIYQRLAIAEHAPEKIAKLDYNGRPVFKRFPKHNNRHEKLPHRA